MERLIIDGREKPSTMLGNDPSIMLTLEGVDEEYQRFKVICEQKNTYPSAAIMEAVMEWMEREDKNGHSS